MIKKVNLEEALEIYNFMKKDFPENEIPDYERFFQMTKENIHNVYVYEENNQELLTEYITTVVDGKLAFSAGQLFIKGVLCNFIVCVGAYVGMKMQDDTAKTIIMMLVVMAFVLPGFEHSIANMGNFTIGITALGTSYDWSLVPLHMLISTAGNIIGGAVLLGVPLFMMIKPKKR